MTQSKLRAHGSTLRRFVGAEVEPDRVVGLSDDHPAVVDGRTLFPAMVVSALDPPRLLVSGHNNSKLGGKVMKGERKGWPIYHLALEERATCPRSCAVWNECYGNSTHLSRRHRNDEHLIPALESEVAFLSASHPKGFLVRLHSLGDFYSLDYLEAWTDMMSRHDQLHMFGFTAHDPNASEIGRAIADWTEVAWDRFAIRFSHPTAIPQGSYVVTKDPKVPEVVVCPAQTHATACCATCGLCWAPAFQHGTIAFLLHGMKRFTGKRGPPLAAAKAPERLAAVDQSERERIAAAYGATFRK